MKESKMRLVCIEKVQIALWLPTEIVAFRLLIANKVWTERRARVSFLKSIDPPSNRGNFNN